MSWQAWTVAGCMLTALAVMFSIIRATTGDQRAGGFGISLAIFAGGVFVAAAVVAWPAS